MLCCHSPRWNRVRARSKTRERYWSPISLRLLSARSKRLVASISSSRTLRTVAEWVRQSGRPTVPAPLGVDQAIGRLQAVVEAVVDVAELEELDVGELDHLQACRRSRGRRRTRPPSRA